MTNDYVEEACVEWLTSFGHVGKKSDIRKDELLLWTFCGWGCHSCLCQINDYWSVTVFQWASDERNTWLL